MDDIVVTTDGSLTCHSHRYQQSYHSCNGALTEARHVFLEASGVSQRLEQSLSTCILEIGFGLGLNTLLTSDLAATHGARLAYHSMEHDLVDAAQVRRMNYGSLLANAPLSDVLIGNLERVAEKRKTAQSLTRHTFALGDNIEVTLHLEDATKTHFLDQCNQTFNAIYLDAFSPDANAECWQPDFIAQLAQTLSPHGKISTYCAKGDVRRAMLSAGLQVQKLPGPPGKREMLVGMRT